VLRADSRAQGLGSRLLSTALSLINLKRFRIISLCTVGRGLNHPRRHDNYYSPDYLWEKYVFVKSNNLLAYLAWKDIGRETETPKPMDIWLKKDSEKEDAWHQDPAGGIVEVRLIRIIYLLH